MKKFILLILSIVIVFNANNVNAQEYFDEEDYPLVRISPHVGTICGIDVAWKFSPNLGLYAGIGKNFRKKTDDYTPEFYEVGGTYTPNTSMDQLKSETKETFRISFGYAGNNSTIGAHIAFIETDVTFGAYDMEPSHGGAELGYGVEGSYSFLGNLFIKLSATYYRGEDDFEGGSNKTIFYPGSWSSHDNRIGKGWVFGAAIGYHFYYL